MIIPLTATSEQLDAQEKVQNSPDARRMIAIVRAYQSAIASTSPSAVLKKLCGVEKRFNDAILSPSTENVTAFADAQQGFRKLIEPACRECVTRMKAKAMAGYEKAGKTSKAKIAAAEKALAMAPNMDDVVDDAGHDPIPVETWNDIDTFAEFWANVAAAWSLQGVDSDGLAAIRFTQSRNQQAAIAKKMVKGFDEIDDDLPPDIAPWIAERLDYWQTQLALVTA